MTEQALLEMAYTDLCEALLAFDRREWEHTVVLLRLAAETLRAADGPSQEDAPDAAS